MAKFMLVYRGEGQDMSTFTEAQVKELMDAWGAWMGGLGTQLIDGGAPCGDRTNVVDDGTTGTPANITGYSIVEAADLDGAVATTTNHPYLSAGKGDNSIDVVELVPM